MNDKLQKKVDQAIKLIQSASKIASEHGQPLEIAYSGGKDSDVILELTKMAKVPYRAIYKNTTIDVPGTVKHVKEMGVEVRMPEKSFFQLVNEYGLPSRFRRFCCGFLKEYKILDYAVLGIRAEESVKRKAKYKEPEKCRVYPNKDKVRQYMPILYWTSQDVEDFIKERNIKCAPVYYDEEGNFHVGRRLGCMGCPLASKQKRLAQFKQYPNLIKAYVRALKDSKPLTHTHTHTHKRFANAYEWLVFDLFYADDPQSWNMVNDGLFDKPDYKKILEDYFNIKL